MITIPKVLFTSLVLILIFEKFVDSCPEKCECLVLPDHSVSVSCNGVNLDIFPEILPNGTSRVVLANNPRLQWPITEPKKSSWVTVKSFVFTNNYPVDNLTIESISWLSSIEKLSLKNASLKSLEFGLFRNLTEMTELDLSFNPNLEYDPIFNAITVYNTHLQHLNITYCNQLPFQHKVLRQRHFGKLRHSPLKILDMTSVNLFHIEPGISRFLPRLEVLNISDNHMKVNFHTLCHISLLPNLLVFDASYWNFPDPFYTVDNSNLTDEPCNKDFGDEKSCFPLAETLQLFYFHHIRWSSAESPSISKCLSKNNMTKVWINNNNYRLLNGTIRGAEKLHLLDLSENKLEFMAQLFMIHEPILRVVNLSSNRFWKMQDHPEFKILLQKNPLLQHVDLSNNNLTKVPSKMFQNNSDLVHIDLAQNKLSDLDLDLSSPYIRYLDLSVNRIRSINVQFRQKLDQLASNISYHSVDKYLNISEDVPMFNSSVLTVDLSANPLDCSCDTQDFLLWLITSDIHFKNLNSYSCVIRERTRNISSLDAQNISKLCDIVLDDQSIAFICCGCFVFVILVILLVLYRFHRKRLMQRKITKYKSTGPPKYIAFVCYSHHDNDFVLRHLRPEIEHRLASDMSRSDGLLCINDRDFCIGEPIEEAIVRSVLASSMVILVLSEKFLDSQWCKFETNVAWIEKKPILMILKEKLVIKKLPYLLRNIYNKNVRLLWPGESGKSQFLQTLYNSILNCLSSESVAKV